MNSNGPIVQNTLTTIPQAAAEPVAPVTEASSEAGEPPLDPAASGEASVAEPEPDRQLEIAQRFEMLSRKEAAARRRDAEYQAKMQSLSEKEKAMEEKLAELEGALSDPIDYYMKRGKDPVEIAKRFVKPETEEEKRIRLLEDRLSKREQQEREADEKAKQAAESRARYQAMRSFVEAINPDDHPFITSLYAAPEVPSLVTELLHRPTSRGGPTMLELFREQNGRNPTNAEIVEVLEHEAGERATRVLERYRSAQSQDDSVQPQSGPSGISNQHAAQTHSSNGRRLSKEEQRRKAKEELTAALEAESVSRSDE